MFIYFFRFPVFDVLSWEVSVIFFHFNVEKVTVCTYMDVLTCVSLGLLDPVVRGANVMVSRW